MLKRENQIMKVPATSISLGPAAPQAKTQVNYLPPTNKILGTLDTMPLDYESMLINNAAAAFWATQSIKQQEEKEREPVYFIPA